MAHGDPRLHVHQRQLARRPKGGTHGELWYAVLVATTVVVHGFVVLRPHKALPLGPSLGGTVWEHLVVSCFFSGDLLALVGCCFFLLIFGGQKLNSGYFMVVNCGCFMLSVA